MTQQGLDAIENAKKNGTWDLSGRVSIGDEQIQAFKQIIQQYEPAFTNLLAMPLSIQKDTVLRFYLDAKTDKTRQTRLEKIIDRLNKNLKPMWRLHSDLSAGYEQYAVISKFFSIIFKKRHNFPLGESYAFLQK